MPRSPPPSTSTTADECRRELLRLLERDVRRERRHGRVGDRLQHDRSVRGERLVPRAADLVRVIHPDAPEADQLRVASVWEIRDELGVRVHWIALQYPLLPRDL